MQGKIQDCKSAFVVDENGHDLKISDRDEVNELKGQVSNLNSQISSLKIVCLLLVQMVALF
ncbi:hypothetical protein [Apilactobacillus micheneri]|uniref:hypothetical protein n=1 Tax=Apilactobacillus micheneri TaxID=1899430 RepID=UPI000D03C8C6|nr:hypothetical protein [Apilactobacillus micheneri]